MKYKIEKRLIEMDSYKPIEGSYRIRLDANESFFSIPKAILDEFSSSLKQIDFNRYPDPFSVDICTKFALYNKIESNMVVAGNGSDELINLIIQVFAKDNDKVMVFQPDFSMYAFYSNLRRCNVNILSIDIDSVFDVNKIIDKISEIQPSILIFSNPCNPTGQVIKKEDIVRICEVSTCLIVVDEAYMDFANESVIKYVNNTPNLIVLRTMSKAFAAAAIRLGFLIANKELSAIIKKVKAPYNVNTVTQTLGSILLNHAEENKKRIDEIIEQRDLLYNGLSRIKSLFGGEFKAYKSYANFVFIKTKKAEEIFYYLLKNGISIRLLNSETLRITAGSKEELNELFKILRTLE